jgi:hypothetical protein
MTLRAPPSDRGAGASRSFDVPAQLLAIVTCALPTIALIEARPRGSVVGLLINRGFYGQLLVVTLFFQEQRGYDALTAGLALMPEAVFVSLGSLVSGRLIARASARLPMVIGLLTGHGAGARRRWRVSPREVVKRH